MLKFSLVAAVVGTLLMSTVSEAQEFQAPNFVPGTEFIFEMQNFGNPTGQFSLNYQGKDEKGNYDFGKYIYSASLQRGTKGKELWAAIPVKFPLTLGQTWEYSYTFDRSPRCHDQTNELKAQVGSSLEKVAVGDTTFEVVSIKHDGTWLANCPGGTPQGKLNIEYLYSPKLGMFVSVILKIWSPRGDLNTNTNLNLVSFSVPGQK
jgi:hypothetical protein